MAGTKNSLGVEVSDEHGEQSKSKMLCVMLRKVNPTEIHLAGSQGLHIVNELAVF